MDNEATPLAKVRTWIVHLVYTAYYICLWVGLGKTLDKFEDTYSRGDTIAAGVLLSLAFTAAQAVLIWLALWKRHKMFNQTWCHVPMLVFIIFSLGPYGMALNYEYKAANPKLLPNTTGSVGENSNCFNITVPEFHFVVFQIVMIILVLTHLIYPFPNRHYKRGELYAIGIEFLNAFDIMDLVADIGYVQSYQTGWLVCFFIATGVSTVLLAFPCGLEDRDDEDPKPLQRLTSIFTLLFTDFSFFILRVVVIHNEKSVQSGFNFLMKNLLAAFIRFILILKS
ncbi:uncharacterized protein LOC130612258 [Hydractinia symbiolongicarpus]|uniref:uncharacterized protein LOC130612258 n=1 Tax=Hydractinia symbiolongicarpus TaxID=13093 RepID=UPI00254DBCB0|nr:uncharacterized protein LOC130612258 [Hydractinia symbiolongicarpus]